jgi:hypothetical protein
MYPSIAVHKSWLIEGRGIVGLKVRLNRNRDCARRVEMLRGKMLRLAAFAPWRHNAVDTGVSD